MRERAEKRRGAVHTLQCVVGVNYACVLDVLNVVSWDTTAAPASTSIRMR